MSAAITFINETEDEIVRESYNESRSRKRPNCDRDSESDEDTKEAAECDPFFEPTDLSRPSQMKDGPRPGKKTKGRVKIKMEFIENKLRRYTTFSKRKTGIMKKACELSTLTGTQVMLLVASETGHVYTFATRKLQPMVTSEYGKALIQTCLNSPDTGSANNGKDLFGPNLFGDKSLQHDNSQTATTSSDVSQNADDVADVSGEMSEKEESEQVDKISTGVTDAPALFTDWTKVTSQVKAPVTSSEVKESVAVTRSISSATPSSAPSIVYRLPVALNQFVVQDSTVAQSNTVNTSAAQGLVPMPVAIVAGGVSGTGPVLYQTANGLMYAAAAGTVASGSSGVPAHMFSLPQANNSLNSITVQSSSETTGGPLLIPLPVQLASSPSPVSLTSQHMVVAQQRAADVKGKRR